MPGVVLVVDDEVELAKGLNRLLRNEGYQAHLAHSAAQARVAMARTYPDVVLMDLQLPDGDGSELMQELRADCPGAQFIIITAHGSIRSAVEATKRGAFDYLPKPFEPAEMLVAVQNALREHMLSDELHRLRETQNPARGGAPADSTIPYESTAIRRTAFLARRASQQDGIVLLLGESGTGKDFWSHWIHEHSGRRDGPFFAINCAALSRELAESELFGHEPGAFTGTRGRKRGLLELAEKGTLLLNEIGELEPPLQSKLLTFLDTRGFVRVGGERSITIDARIVAATNRDLEAEVARGAFRQDLFYRINVFPIEVPPLRERIADLPTLVQEILTRLVRDLGLAERPTVTDEALEALRQYAWPGNVRELRNVIERTLMLSEDGRVTGANLGLRARTTEWRLEVPFPMSQSLHEVTNDVARRLVEEALRRTTTKQQAATLLGLSRHALAHQIKVLGLDA